MRHRKLSVVVAVAGSAWIAGDLAAQTKPWGTLTWDDFQGTPPPGSEWGAETWSGADGSWDGTKPLPPAAGQKKAGLKDVRASSSFDKSKSWVKPDKKTDALLEHEQYHFDITEYWARELEKALRGVVGCGSTQAKANDDAEAKGQAAKTKCAEDCKKLQAKYDEETDHSRKADKQKEWCKKIGELLNVGQAPAPQTGGKTEEPRKMYFDPETNEVIFEPIELTSFAIGDASVADDMLAGAAVLLPPMRYGGDYMPDSMSMILPIDAEASDVVIVSASGDVLAKANLRLVMASDHEPQLAGFLEGVVWSDEARAQSKVVAALDDELRSSLAFMMIRIDTPAHLRDATNNFTAPAQVDMQVTVGSTSCWPANPPILGQPESQSVPRGATIRLDAFVPVAGDLRYQWFLNGSPIRDDGRVRGATTPNLVVHSATSSDSGKYTAHISGRCGASTTEPADVTVGGTKTTIR